MYRPFNPAECPPVKTWTQRKTEGYVARVATGLRIGRFAPSRSWARRVAVPTFRRRINTSGLFSYGSLIQHKQRIKYAALDLKYARDCES